MYVQISWATERATPQAQRARHFAVPKMQAPGGVELSQSRGAAQGEIRNPGNQKLSLSPSCIIRGSRVEVTWLNSVEVKLVDAQQIGLVWLNVLNVSQRN